MIKISDLKGMTREQANELIGQESDHGKIIGVDNRPPKHMDGVWLVTSQPNEKCQRHRVDC